MFVLNNKYIRYILYVVIGLALLTSLWVSARRFKFESRHKRVEIVLSFSDTRRLSLWAGGENPYTLLERFKKEAGLTGVVLEEETLEDFIDQGRITALRGSDIMNMYRVGNVNQFILTRLYQQVKVLPDHYYLIIDEQSDYERVKQFLSAEFGKEHVIQIGQFNILEVVDNPKDLMQVGLGFSDDKVQIIKAIGLKPIFQLGSGNRLSKEMIELKFASIASQEESATIIFDGLAILGYPSQIPYVQNQMQDHDMNLGLVEFRDQFGLEDLSRRVSERVLRVHYAKEEDKAYEPRDKWVDRYVRAAKERGIKILWVSPYFKSMDASSVIDYNVGLVKQINNGIKEYGMVNSSIKTLNASDYKAASSFELLIISLGVFTTILFLINYFVKIRVKILLGTYFIFAFLFYLCSFLQILTLWSQVLAMFTAIIFPSLAIISQFPKQGYFESVKNRTKGMMVFFAKIMGITLAGAMLIVGLLSHVEFLFSVDKFFGVKLAFIIPLGCIGLYFFLRPQRISSTIYVLKRLFDAPVRTIGLVSIAVCLGALSILIIRSGNYNFVSALMADESARTFLERVFHVRPRTKEFLIGYPFLVLAYLMADKEISRQWIWFFVVIGSVSLISLINSFGHVHTPLEISIYRTVLGLVLGIVMGYFYYFGVRVLKWIYSTLL